MQKKNSRGTNFIFGLLLFAAFGLIVSVVVPEGFWGLQNNGKEEEVVVVLKTQDEIDEEENGVRGVYESARFSFSYDPRFLASETGGVVLVSHTVPYVYDDMCDFKDGATQTKFTDFYMSMELVPGSFADAGEMSGIPLFTERLRADGSFREERGVLEKVQIGKFNGYKARIGAEGCGEETYLLKAGEGILIVHRPFRPELTDANPRVEEARSVPGIVLAEEAEAAFRAILDSLVIQ